MAGMTGMARMAGMVRITLACGHRREVSGDKDPKTLVSKRVPCRHCKVSRKIVKAVELDA
jgi:hypothetical protein